ncbi:MAG TPA: hypothetical protein VLC51_02575 [Nitrospira sp.]|nr:hypothetical protein [Nitrospira sp.]
MSAADHRAPCPRTVTRVVCLLLCQLGLGGCAIILPSTPQATTPERSCAPLNPTRFHADDDRSTDRVGADLPFSAPSLEVARVMNAVPLLTELTALERAGETHSVAFMELRQSLTDRLLLTLFEVSSLTAELVCERDRADQVADRMDEVDGSLVKQLTLASIVIGGVAAVVSGGIGLAGGSDVANNAATLAGGVVASLFGGTALFAASKQQFTHERNLLGELWQDPPQSSVFSPAIWRFLGEHRGGGTRTIREEILQAWRQQGRLGEPGSSGAEQRSALVFGKGGMYTSTDLRARASMLETLEAHVNLLAEELEVFLREIIQRRTHG